MSNSQRFTAKTEKKISYLIPTTYRSLSDTKDKEQNSILNAQIMSNCLSRKICTVSITPETFKAYLIHLLEQEGQKASSSLLKQLKTWMEDRWKDLRMEVSSRLNKLKYLQPSLVNQSYSVIEKEIMIEKKKNTLLKGFLLLSNVTFTN